MADRIVAGSAPAVSSILTPESGASAESPVERFQTLRSDGFIGTAPQLVALGLVKADQFPGQPGRPKTSATYTLQGAPIGRGNNRQGVRVINIRPSRGGRFTVLVCVTDEERDRRYEESERLRIHKKTAFKRDREDAAEIARLKSMCQTPETYRHMWSKLFWNLGNGLVESLRNVQESEGYRYSDAAIDDIYDAVCDAYQALECGDVFGTSPARRIEQVMRAGAKADMPLQAFLQSTIAVALPGEQQ